MKLIILVFCCLAACSKAEDINLAQDFGNAFKHIGTGFLNAVEHTITDGSLLSAVTGFLGKRKIEDDITQTLHLAVNQVNEVLKSYSQKIQQAYKVFKNFKGDAKEFQTLLQQMKDSQNVDLYKIVNNVGAAVHSLTHAKRDLADVTSAFQHLVDQLQHPYEVLHGQLLTELQHHHLHHD